MTLTTEGTKGRNLEEIEAIRRHPGFNLGARINPRIAEPLTLAGKGGLILMEEGGASRRPSDAGHDYQAIRSHGFGARLCALNGRPALVAG